MPPPWLELLFPIGAGLAIALFLWWQWRDWQRARRRQKHAEELVRQGMDPDRAAIEAGLPFSQRMVFLGTLRLLGSQVLNRGDRAQPSPGASGSSQRSFVVLLMTGEELTLKGASLEEALKQAGVHPANVVRYREMVEKG